MRRAILLSVLVLGCQGGLDHADVGRAEPQALALPSPRPGELVLDVRADGAALFGALEPAPLDADPDRVLVLRAELAGAPLALDGARVLDARFADGGRVVILGADHILRVHGASEQVRELDRGVHGPLSVAGGRVAYARGEVPDLEIARADLASGNVEAITSGMAPAWSPALSPDGEEVIFTSSVEGSPRLYLARAGSTRALARTERFPTAPSAPRWIGDALIVEDELGVATIDLRDMSIASAHDGAHGLVLLPDGRAGMVRDGAFVIGGAP